MLRILSFLAFFFLVFSAKAQLFPPEAVGGKPQVLKPATQDELVIDRADSTIYINQKGIIFQKLLGKVEMHQSDAFMYCDSAVIQNKTTMRAYGNVIIQQTDTTAVFGDSLIYNSLSKSADLYGDVVLVNGKQKLFSKKLNYNTGTKVARYVNKATLSDGSTKLKSQKGDYYVNENEAFFKGDVIVENPKFSLKTDTLQFNTQTKVATFLAPTLIIQDSARIYCEKGFYDMQKPYAEFLENPQYQKGEQKAYAFMMKYDGQKKVTDLIGKAHFEEPTRSAKADTIRYDETNNLTFLIGNAHFDDGNQQIDGKKIEYNRKTESFSTIGRSRVADKSQILEGDELVYDKQKEIGSAKGNVVWQDTVQHLTVRSEQLNYNKKTDYIKAFGKKRPMLASLVDKDTLFMSSDTLVAFKNIVQKDTNRILLAFKDVRIIKLDTAGKSNLQAVCDSLVYNTTDSLFRFFKSPVIWADTSQQLFADTVNIQLAQSKIDRVFLLGKAFIVDSPNPIIFNQIKGRNITAFFDSSEIRRVHVVGNAESVYYIQDEQKSYIGCNKSICSEMMIHFRQKKLKGIKFYAQPKGTMTPMTQVDTDKMKMDGFRWETKRRPLSLADLE